jgi:hypothetical protein
MKKACLFLTIIVLVAVNHVANARMPKGILCHVVPVYNASNLLSANLISCLSISLKCTPIPFKVNGIIV